VSTRHSGRAAERVAAAFLELTGHSILAANYVHAGREIDIIASRGDRIIFVEVKCRTGESHGTPGEAVNMPKRKRIAHAARAYLKTKGLLTRACRFDLIEVRIGHGGLTMELCHVPAAFGADGRRW
jgi:putative endonuclease